MRSACRHTPAINHAGEPFIENKRCRTKPRRADGVVNRKAASVYQTDAVLLLVVGQQVRLKRALAKTNDITWKQCQGETVQSTSMIKTMSLALLAGAACLG